VVDGRFALVGSDSREANAAIQKAALEPKAAIALSDVVRDWREVRARGDVTVAANLSLEKIGRAVPGNR
jgi:hypothetical protein